MTVASSNIPKVPIMIPARNIPLIFIVRCASCKKYASSDPNPLKCVESIKIKARIEVNANEIIVATSAVKVLLLNQ